LKVAAKRDRAMKEETRALMTRKAEKVEGKINHITVIKMATPKITITKQEDKKAMTREETMMNGKMMVVSKTGLKEDRMVASE